MSDVVCPRCKVILASFQHEGSVRRPEPFVHCGLRTNKLATSGVIWEDIHEMRFDAYLADGTYVAPLTVSR